MSSLHHLFFCLSRFPFPVLGCHSEILLVYTSAVMYACRVSSPSPLCLPAFYKCVLYSCFFPYITLHLILSRMDICNVLLSFAICAVCSLFSIGTLLLSMFLQHILLVAQGQLEYAVVWIPYQVGGGTRGVLPENYRKSARSSFKRSRKTEAVQAETMGIQTPLSRSVMRDTGSSGRDSSQPKTVTH